MGILRRSWRFNVTTCGLAIAAFGMVCAPVGASAQRKPPQTVLTIHWGAEDFPGTAVFDAAIHDALRARLDAPINYFAEYLESEIFPDAASPALRDYLQRKFKGRRIDLVIANTIPV